MGEKPPLEDERVSHAFCDACLDHYAAQWDGLTLGEYLDRFPFPVMAVDTSVRVVAMNTAMVDAISLELEEAIGRLGGEVLECVHARKPEGCGRTQKR